MALETVELAHAGAEEDALVVMRPAHDDVVRSHAVPDRIATQGGRHRQPRGNATGGRHHIDLGVAVILSGKRDVIAVMGKAGKGFIAVMGGESSGNAPRVGHGIEIAAIAKDDLMVMESGKTQQQRLLLSRDQRNRQQHQQQQHGCSHVTPPDRIVGV